jgi:hypothetical protein
MSHSNCGFLAAQAGFSLPLQVLRSAAGFYIGTRDQEGPVSRESVEYFPDEYTANHSMAANMWTQRTSP